MRANTFETYFDFLFSFIQEYIFAASGVYHAFQYAQANLRNTEGLTR